MNEQTANLLKNLADKLGTTSEYLWSVLLKQAPVAAAITCFEIVLTVAVISLIVWQWKRINAMWHGWLEGEEITAFLAMVAFVIFSVVWMIGMVISVESAITAVVNPEYWALDKVMSVVKHK